MPADGCASYRSLYERLEALELDTHLHIHKENHVLFPAALRLAGAGGDQGLTRRLRSRRWGGSSCAPASTLPFDPAITVPPLTEVELA